MPMYTVSTQKPLSEAQRERVVDLVTDVHCQETGAPEVFVQVVFSHGVPLPVDQIAHVLASIRAGRNDQQKANIEERIANGIAEAMHSCLPVKMDIFDVPHYWAMEGGEMMPAPGTEHLSSDSRY